MKYTILTLGNPEREVYRQSIRETMKGYEEVEVPAVNGKTDDLKNAIRYYGFKIKMDNENTWRPGEGGVWFSNINAWHKCLELDEPLLVFEDDAIIKSQFRTVLDYRTPDLEDVDFVSFYSPYKNHQKFPIFSWQTAANNQEHGMVCMLYTPRGSAKIIDLLYKNGLEWPVDIWLFKEAMKGTLGGFVPTYNSLEVVDVDLDVPTNIHDDDRIKVYAV